MPPLKLKKSNYKKGEPWFALCGVGLVGDDGLEPPTYAL